MEGRNKTASVGCPNPLAPTVCAPVFFIRVTSAFWSIHISEKMLCGEAWGPREEEKQSKRPSKLKPARDSYQGRR